MEYNQAREPKEILKLYPNELQYSGWMGYFVYHLKITKGFHDTCMRISAIIDELKNKHGYSAFSTRGGYIAVSSHWRYGATVQLKRTLYLKKMHQLRGK